MQNRKILCGVSFAIFFLLITPTIQAQLPTLEGETFQNADIRQSKVSCFSERGGQIDFAVQGVAVGPFPGTFTENGSLTFDPITGSITGGVINFAVMDDTGATTVKGTKTPRDGTAKCFLDERTGVTTIFASVPTLEYSASIGGSPDEGRATLDLFASIDKTLGLTTLQFTEIFHSSNFVPSTFGKVTGGGTIALMDRSNGVTFGFNAQNTENGMKGSGTVIDHNAGVKVKILDVDSFVISGTHATFTGRAEVNGVEEKYRIDVDDVGEPGTGLDSFKIVTNSYGTGGVLTGGNIQVHK